MIYLVYFRGADMHSEDPSGVIGVYTTRTLAIQAGREAVTNEEDEYLIREHDLNRPSTGVTIWDKDCDTDRLQCRRYYAQYWPTGFPE